MHRTINKIPKVNLVNKVLGLNTIRYDTIEGLTWTRKLSVLKSLKKFNYLETIKKVKLNFFQGIV